MLHSTYDSRYPFAYPVDRPLPGLATEEMRDARRVGGAVASRTGTRCFYNAAKGRLYWVYGAEPGGGPLGVEFKTKSGLCRRYHSGDIDDMVAYINRGKMSRAEKDRIAAETERRAELDRENAVQKELADGRRDTESYAAFLDRKRRGTGTLVSV